MTPEPIQPLIHRHLDGTATPEEASRLALALLDDPEVAREFAHATRLEAGLRGCFQSETIGRRLAATVRFEASQRRRPIGRGWAAAAAVLVLAGLSLAWWRPWGRTVAPVVAAEKQPAAAQTVTDAPPPPPSLRRAGALSPAATEVKRLASRYWLPEAIEFSGTPLAEAVAVVQQHAASVNHRQNGLIAGFAIDVPEDVADAPVTARRADLPLSAWLDILSAQVGCELRFTDTGAAFDPVEQPDRIETRRFPLPSIAAATAPTESPARLFSYSRPWDEEPSFGSVPAHGTTLAAAWGIPMQGPARVLVKADDSLEVRHTRRELRRIDGLLAAATADAGRPTIAFRAKDVPLPAGEAPAVTGGAPEAAMDHATAVNQVHNHLKLGLGYYDLGEFNKARDHFNRVLSLDPYNTAARRQLERIDRRVNSLLAVDTTYHTRSNRSKMLREVSEVWETTIDLPALGTSSPATGNRIVSNDEAAALLAQSSPFSGITNAEIFAQGYRDGLAASQASNFPGEGITDHIKFTEEHIKSYVDRMQLSRFFNTTWSSAPEITIPGNARPAVAEKESEIADPWQQTGRTTARLGETVRLATGATLPPPFDADGDSLTVGFSLLDMQPKPLTAAARLEGELIKLTGAYTPPDGGSPTDFQAYVGEGQAFILQTEDAPVAAVEPMPMGSGIVWGNDALGRNGRLVRNEVEYGGFAEGVQVDNGVAAPAAQPEFAAHTNGVVMWDDATTSWELAQPTFSPDGTVLAWGEEQPNHTSYWFRTASPLPAPSVRGVVISPVLEWPSVTAR